MYDVCDPRRLRLVAECVSGYGDRVQYSVFVCDLSATELIALQVDLEKLIRLTEDSVMIVDLSGCDESKFSFVGRRPRFPHTDVRIV